LSLWIPPYNEYVLIKTYKIKISKAESNTVDEYDQSTLYAGMEMW
jgi:hypothetical protein